ncbi:MAG: electron transfer flavoprotein subunit beta/FixA family protein [Desulfamplus sp.]|nr:electron transfer flavoprotein subunit beta/FixA family protein [Desulfamplus sp.]
MALNIIVCIKSVILNALPGRNKRTSANIELNPFDKPVIEMALSLTREGQGEVTVISMGPKNATFGLYQAMAMGADRSILISDPAMKESDTYITAKVLGTAIEKLLPADLILFGTRSSDSDTGHVGPQTAEMLNLPFISNIHKLSLAKKEEVTPKYLSEDVSGLADISPSLGLGYNLSVERKMDGYLESFELHTPAAFTVSPSYGNGEWNINSLYGIEDAFNKKSVELWTNETLDLETDKTGLAASPTKIISWNKVKKIKNCTFIEGAPEQKAQQLTEKLLQAGFIG